jgi:hypothetical protein
MTKHESRLRNAEAFVKAVVEKEFKQKIDSGTLRAAAIKACSGIPMGGRPTSQRERHRTVSKTHGGRREVTA